ncbi:hypothetical protein BaRGS_00015215 [Batillaria attramentaria]|uniref:Uncharacterized protein n=1 Tax=Batillaria attramentaria TaxID=370345 RepID=A0ABD0L265_9CAEN
MERNDHKNCYLRPPPLVPSSQAPPPPISFPPPTQADVLVVMATFSSEMGRGDERPREVARFDVNSAIGADMHRHDTHYSPCRPILQERRAPHGRPLGGEDGGRCNVAPQIVA